MNEKVSNKLLLLLVVTILFSTLNLQKCNKAMKSTNGCFVTAINGQHFIVMLITQNLGIYNSIRYLQSNSIFCLRKNKGKIYCKTYLQLIKASSQIQYHPKSYEPISYSSMESWRNFSLHNIGEHSSFSHSFSAHLILTSLLCSLIIPIVITHWCQTPTQR